MTGAGGGAARAGEWEWASNARHRKRRAADATGRVTGIVDGAREVLVASTFLLANDAVADSLLRASNRGVRCYLLLATEERLRRDEEAAFEQGACERHVRTLGRLQGSVLVRSADEFHAKAVVSDPMSDAPRGIIMTANLTEEALGRNQELFVDLTEDEAREAGMVLREALWERATRELAGGDLRSCRPLGKVGSVATDRVLQGGSNPQLRERLYRMLDARPKKVVASSFGWDGSHPVVDRLCRLAEGGADVTILARARRPAAMGALERLRAAGARVAGFSWLHAKAVATESEAVVMSANIEPRGLEKRFEMGIALGGRRAADIRGALDRWASNPEFVLSKRQERQGGAGAPVLDPAQKSVVPAAARHIASRAGTPQPRPP